MSEISGSLNRFKAAYGVQPPGTVTTLDNGVVGTWLEDGTLRTDFVPQAVRDAAEYRLAGGAPGPSNSAPFTPPFVPPPAIPPRSPYLPPPVNWSTSNATPPPAPAPAKIFGLPPLAVAAGAGLLIFLVARRL